MVEHEDSTPGNKPASRPAFATHFVQSVLVTWAGNGLRIIVGIVALRLVTTSIVESDLGTYWIITSVAALLAKFADLGVGLAAVRHIPLARDDRHAQRLMQTILLLRLAMLGVLCVAIFLLEPWILAAFDARSIGSIYKYLYPFVLLNSLAELYTNFLQGKNRFRAIALFTLASSLGRLLFIVALVRGLQYGIHGLFIAEVLSITLGAVLSAWASGHGLPPRLDRGEVRTQLGFGFPLHLNMVLSYTANRINTLIIGSMSGPIGVSYFTVASRLPQQLSMGLSSYVSVFLPSMTRLLAEQDRDRARRLLAASLRTMSFAFAMITLVLSFFRREILHLLAPPSYQAAAPALPLLVGSLTFASLGTVLGNTIVALGDSKTPVKINFWTSLVSLALNLALIQRWGFMGAAWATFIFNVIAYAITDVVLAKRLQPQNRSYLVILAFLAGCLGFGYNAGLVVRLLLLGGALAGSLGLSPGLRADLRRIWQSSRRSRPVERVL